MWEGKFERSIDARSRKERVNIVVVDSNSRARGWLFRHCSFLCNSSTGPRDDSLAVNQEGLYHSLLP